MTDRRPGRLRLALPWLGAGSSTAASDASHGVVAAAGEWLASRGRVESLPVESWREWLIGELGVEPGFLARFPAGPCVRALDTGRRPEGTWACARPVHLLTALDHLQLAPGALSLDAAEADALLADINRHLDGRGWRLHPSRHGCDWQLECTLPVDCESLEPAEAAGRNLRELMPSGRDGARVRSLVNELQMLLHEHPVNESRASRGLVPVNSIWLWGFGRAAQWRPVELPELWSDDAWFSGAWQMHEAPHRPLQEFARSGASPRDTLVIHTGRFEASTEAALQRAENDVLAPARAMLERGAVAEIVWLAGRHVVRVDRHAGWRFWRRPRPLHEVFA